VRHVDLYRLESADIRELGWRDLFYGPAVAVVEWADKASSYLPDRTYLVAIAPDPAGDPGRRIISISGPPARQRPRANGSGDAKGEGLGRSPGPALTVFRPDIAAGMPSPVLAIDTSTRSRSLALLAGGEIREKLWAPAGDSLPAEDLSASLKELLDDAGVRVADLQLIAVSLGPGSFTGVKVGLASAKALAYALGCPLKGVPTLDILAAGALAGPGRLDPDDRPEAVLCLLDARRGDVFGAVYRHLPRPLPLPDRGSPYLVGPAEQVIETLVAALRGSSSPPGAWAHRRPPRLAILGDGVDDRLIGRFQFPGWGLDRLTSGRRHPRASDLILLAREGFVAGAGDDPFALQPLYLREPEVSVPGRQGGL
jgi:tRNA threonylcarbamoyladenosine biosynthesis protein TsaB